MKFKELMNLSADQAGNIGIDELTLNLPNTPKDVLEQFYRDHGRKYQFQEQYAELDIHNLNWELVSLSFDEMSSASIFPNFQKWVNTCYMKSCRVSTDLNWKLIENTNKTVMHWKHNHTWIRSPIFLESDCKLHLVEGHSRFGCLKGLVSNDLISSNKTHKVWLAKSV
ncbi:hypothetical protein [Marinagarivorans algicola]|uniref:hypothetical protein n=1 Tax=Marinagarivorans algicola TaxID=1513270 RepID=UPI0012E0D80F|nr:hypothetical protein [Marinagarivorans algicola]